MATLSTTFPTLLDIARFTMPDGSISRKIAELLSYDNDMLDDIPWVEGNTNTGHVSIVRSSQPAGTWRLLNQGVAATKSTAAQIVNPCGLLESLSQIDVEYLRLGGNGAGLRFQQDKGHMQGLMNTMADTLIYGDQGTTPETFDGLAVRYGSLGTTYTTYNQLINAGGVGSDNTSIWLVCWSPDKVYGIYPKGTQAGLEHEDHGEITISDPNNSGSFLRVAESRFIWRAGIAVDDYRSIGRIVNIDMSNLETSSDGTDTSANIIKYMSQLLDKVQFVNRNGVRPVFYMNARVRAMLRVKLLNFGNNHLSYEDVSGAGNVRRRELHFLGVPCRTIGDGVATFGILNTESQITTASTP